MPYPLPNNIPPATTVECAATVTIVDDEQYVHILLGALEELADSNNYDDDGAGGNEQVAAYFREVIESIAFSCP